MTTGSGPFLSSSPSSFWSPGSIWPSARTSSCALSTMIAPPLAWANRSSMSGSAIAEKSGALR